MMGMGLGMVIHRRVVVRLFMVRRLRMVILLVMDRIMRLRMVHWFLVVVVKGLLNVMDRGNKYFFLHHSLHHGHRFAIVGVLDVTIVIIVLIVVVVIVNHRYSGSY